LAERAARLGMDRELLAARMVGRWKSGAPPELTPLHDNAALGADDNRNNDFEFGDDPFQCKCPYAAHIRKAYPRDDTGNEAEVQRHRIIRAGIPFGPEVEPGETTRFANVVGRENVIAGADCGFASFSTTREVHPTIVWAILAALAEGARIAAKELWGSA
jgi:deferrochelatase/peroxidase EfeB